MTKKKMMITRSSVIRRLSSALFWLVTVPLLSASQPGSVELYTTNTKISIPPGESINYKIEAINHGESTVFCNLSISGIPSSWSYSLKSDGYNVQQVALQPGGKATLLLDVQAPLKVNKGNYRITVRAGNATLPLVVNISRQGSYKTEFTSDQVNMEGHSKSNFTFNAKLRNRTGEKQLYSLRSEAPRGWEVNFKPNYKQATSVEIEPNSSKDISIEVKPPQNIEAGTYRIPVAAVNDLSSAELGLEVVISGTYEILLTTPDELVSTKITAGNEKDIALVVRNVGSAVLQQVKMSAATPSNWKATFDPPVIESIVPGQDQLVHVNMKADKQAITGDYETRFTARVPETSSELAFRVAVKTPALWGWIGILVIIAALAIIVYLFRKYGRR